MYALHLSSRLSDPGHGCRRMLTIAVSLASIPDAASTSESEESEQQASVRAAHPYPLFRSAAPAYALLSSLGAVVVADDANGPHYRLGLFLTSPPVPAAAGFETECHTTSSRSPPPFRLRQDHHHHEPIAMRGASSPAVA